MRNRLAALTALVTVAVTSGCGLLESAVGSPAAPQPTATATATVTVTATATAETKPKAAADMPDPCTLLDKAEVTDLTGREITQIDEDGGSPGDVTRFCQWQQEGGQLAVFLTRTTPADFQVTVAEAQPVDGLGQDAYTHSGHLYVLHGTVQIDVYSRGGSDHRNLADAEQVAGTLLARI